MTRDALKPAPLYVWALDEAGQPTPIEQAKPHYRYVCPLCEAGMIPRLGQINQHHYGHEAGGDCAPAKVTLAALRRWLGLALRRALAERQPLIVSWRCRVCGGTHQTDLVKEVTQVTENAAWGSIKADVALLNAKGEISAAFLLDDTRGKNAKSFKALADQATLTLLMPLIEPSQLGDWLAVSKITGGVCELVRQRADTDPELIRQTFREAVASWPGYFYGELKTVNGLANTLCINGRDLWLPPEVWRSVIGGTRNPLASGIQIIIQTWPQLDGSSILLYYITVRDTAAVGVQRLAPGRAVNPQLDERFRHSRTTALDLAKHLVKG